MSQVNLESEIRNIESCRSGYRCAVTGSTGMIGSHLVAELVRAGYSDIVLPVRNHGRIENIRRTFERLGVEWNDNALTVVEADLADANAMTVIFRGVDTVFNCAAVIMTGDLTAQQLIDNNVAVSRGVAQAAVRAGVRKVIHTSSIVVLAAEGRAGEPINEDCPVHGDAHGSPYARSKYLSEMEMRRAEEAGLGLTVLYPAVVLGEGDWSLKGSSALIPIMASGQPFYVNGVMAYADVRDVARAYLAVDASPEAAGHGFIVGGANLSYRELFDMGAAAAGKRKPSVGVGRRTLMFGYGIIKALTSMRQMKDMSIRKSNIESVVVGNRYDGTKITRVCAFEYTPIAESVDRIVKAYRAEKSGRS